MHKTGLMAVVCGWALACEVSAGLLNDSSFESPETNDWTGSAWSGSGCSREAWAARSGARGVAVPAWSGTPGSTSQAGVVQFVGADITPGQAYTLSAWILKQPAVRDRAIQLEVRWWDAGWVALTTQTRFVSVPGDERWHQVFLTCTAEAPASVHATVHVQVQWLPTNTVGGAALMLDDVQFDPGPFAGEPFSNGAFTHTNTESGGFAGSCWTRAMLDAGAGSPALALYDWANRSGAGRGAVLEGWSDGSGGAELSQNVSAAPGTYTFAVWINRQARFGLSNAELRIGWYDDSFTNRVQPDTVLPLAVSGVDGWHEYWVSGSCASPALREMRVTVAGRWGAVDGQANALWIDDARVFAGPYAPAYAAAFTNGGFENPADTETWDGSGWSCSGNARRTNWTARTGNRGVVVESWAANQTAVFQELGSTGGVCTLSTWMLIQTNADPRSLQLAVEWGGEGGSVIRADRLDLSPVPRDGSWHCAVLSSACTNAGVRFVRPVLFALYGAEKVPDAGANIIGFDDVEFAFGLPAIPASFTNGGFESPAATNLWEGSGWTAAGSVSRETWAGRTSAWGGVFHTWSAGAGEVSQDMAATGGTYTLSAWVLRQKGAHATNMLLRLEWYSATRWDPVHADSARLDDTVPADGRWHHVWVTSTYSGGDALLLRSRLTCQFAAGETGENAILFDDLALAAGAHAMPGFPAALRDGGFEAPATNWSELDWSRLGPVSLADWGALDGALGAVLPTWDGDDGVVLYQDVAATPGTRTFAMWVRRQTATRLTHASMALEWYTDAQFAPVRVDRVSLETVPADGLWHSAWVTGAYEGADLAFVRPVFAGEYAQATQGETAIMLDGADLYVGPPAGTRGLANGSFAEGLKGWTVTPGHGQVAPHLDWGGLSGSHLLAVEGWWGEEAAYTTVVAQTLVRVAPGTYRFAGSFKRDLDFALQQARLRVRGYNSSRDLLFEAVTNLAVVPDGRWAEFALAVDCSDAALVEVVPSLEVSWRPAGGSLQLDDFSFQPAGAGNPDTDGDGIADAWEIERFGSLGASGSNSNYDHDAYTDWAEYVADTDPLRAESVFGFFAPTNAGAFRVFIGPPTTNTRLYQLVWRTNLLHGGWVSSTVPLPGRADGGAIEVLVTNEAPGAYYRARVSVP